MDNGRKCLAVILMLDILDTDTDDDDIPPRRGKTRKWIKRRNERGAFNTIIRELSVEDSLSFKEMLRMDQASFRYILSQIEKDITPDAPIFGGNTPISAAERLALTIRFLATGETFRSLSFQFRISRRAISYIVREVCRAIIKILSEKYMNVLSTPDEWIKISNIFYERWNFPHALGAVDGKHIIIQPPKNAGSHYYNYKHSHSIILMAIAGPNYECLYADIGVNGRCNDGSVWSNCGLHSKLENGELGLPPDSLLPNGSDSVPYVFLGDDAFALSRNMMKPYPQKGLTVEKRIYNYRHSRARRISENLFGILANRWRIFRSAIALSPEFVREITMATLILHNYLRESASIPYCPVGFTDSESFDGEVIPGSWRTDSPEVMIPLQVPRHGNNPSIQAKDVRNIFSDYFIDQGAVSWQWKYC